MGFQITTPTALPVNLSGTHDSWTWGETGGPFAVPAEEDPGLGNVALPADTLNYEFQHGARWSRAMRDRMAMSDEGFLTSCILKQGAWNTGGGTLNVTLTPTRLVIDVDGNGGTVIEVTAPAGSPETLTANRDTYVDFDESGGYTLAAVPNNDPPPAVTPGHVRVYKLVTNATELLSVGLVGGVAPFPCFGPTVGALSFAANDVTVTNTLDVGGPATFSDDATFDAEIVANGPATFASEVTITSAGSLAVQTLSNFSAPSYGYTHAVAADWRDSCRPSRRTFAVAGTVAGGGETVKTAITTTTGSNTLFSINDLTPTTNSAFVAFDVEFMIVWSNDANPPTGGAGLKTSVTWTAVASYNAGTWGSTTNGAQTIVGAALGGSVVSLDLDAGVIKLVVVHDLGVENRGYRWFADIRGRVMQLAT